MKQYHFESILPWSRVVWPKVVRIHDLFQETRYMALVLMHRDIARRKYLEHLRAASCAA